MEKNPRSFRSEHNLYNKFYKILPTIDYLTDHLLEVQDATQRVWLQTMALESGHFTNLLTQHLIAAAKRGVDVRVSYDAYSTFVTDNRFNHLPALNREQREHQRFVRRNQLDMIQSLKECCAVVQTNYPMGISNILPFRGVRGRDHKKISIVDDVAYIGGVNMAPLDAQRTDFMLKTNDVALTDKLSLIFLQSFHGMFVSNSLIAVNDEHTLLIDQGKRGESIVMRKTYDLVNEEDESIILISPFLPSGMLRKALNSASDRGVDVQIITSPKKLSGFTPRISQMVHNFRQVFPRFEIFRYTDVVHAKALLIGSKAAIIGSHNFDELFVRLGTEEISLLTSNPEIISQLAELATTMRQASKK